MLQGRGKSRGKGKGMGIVRGGGKARIRARAWAVSVPGLGLEVLSSVSRVWRQGSRVEGLGPMGLGSKVSCPGPRV